MYMIFTATSRFQYEPILAEQHRILASLPKNATKKRQAVQTKIGYIMAEYKAAMTVYEAAWLDFMAS